MYIRRSLGDDAAAKQALAVNGTVLLGMVAIPLVMIFWDERKSRRRHRRK